MIDAKCELDRCSKQNESFDNLSRGERLMRLNTKSRQAQSCYQNIYVYTFRMWIASSLVKFIISEFRMQLTLQKIEKSEMKK